jgi:hypothetical protein
MSNGTNIPNIMPYLRRNFRQSHRISPNLPSGGDTARSPRDTGRPELGTFKLVSHGDTWRRDDLRRSVTRVCMAERDV